MKFEISRTSVAWWDLDAEGPPPIAGAKREKCWYLDQRTFKSFAEHDAVLRKPFTAQGTDHKVEYGPDGEPSGISRIMDGVHHNRWVIEVGSLKALMALVDAEERIVVQKEGMFIPFLPKIEIYDTWRE